MATDSSTPTAMCAWPLRIRLLQALLVASLVGAGTAHEAGAQETAKERPLDLSLPRDAFAWTGMRKLPADGDSGAKPYGSGYEARGLSAAKGNAVTAAGPASGASAAGDASGARAKTSAAGSRPPAGAHRGGGAGRGGRR